MLGLLVTGSVSLYGQSTASKEYQVKAIFLFNFAQFVEWPAGAFVDPQKPLIIGVLGEDPFGAYLDDTVRGEKVNGRPLAVERYRRMDEVKTCHILFISRSETARLKQVLDGLKARTILSVCDIDEFCRHGGMIQFATEKGKIRLKINMEAAKAAHLKISSKLLRTAEIVASGSN
jgi:hypothetical protein